MNATDNQRRDGAAAEAGPGGAAAEAGWAGGGPRGGASAVIGMAGRFPNAPDVATLWRRLLDGTDCVTGSIGASPYSADGRWSRDGGIGIPAGHLDGYDAFDAGLFGVSPLEARITDPQHRLVLEAAWAALEDAGHGAAGDLRVGVFATSSVSGYLWTNVRANAAVLAATDDTQLALGNAPDFLASRVAFKLGLRGPAVTVQAACSSSLVAVHLAGQSLAAGECDLAVVASASVTVSPWCATGPDGAPVAATAPTRCRSFSVDAEHTVTGDGVVAVVLRRLDDAVRDNDPVRAVIRGSAVTNDGADKMGFATPAVDGQVAAVRGALAAAGVDPATVGYVEGHGSGTPIGDSIELVALAEGYGPHPAGPRPLGSLKSNIGYLDGTAGLAGLVKTALALQTGVIPGNLHFTGPHPEADAFTVVAATTPWPAGDHPRRAGVASYAMGGTNVHLILEQPPTATARAARSGGGGAGRHQVLTVSAATAAAADAAVARLTAHLAAGAGGADPADVAYTLQVGRRALAHRRAAVLTPGADPTTLTWIAGPTDAGTASRPAPSSAAPSSAASGDPAAAAWALAAAWVSGSPVDWAAEHAGRAPRRVPLPAYPFQRERHWVDPDPVPAAPSPVGTRQAAAPVADRWDEAYQRLLAAGTEPVQAAVAGVWCEILGVTEVGAGDDFFALGGDSLRLLRVTGRLRDLFGLDVPLPDAFAARRVDQLIELLEDLVIREAVG